MLLMSAKDIEVAGWDQLTGYGRLDVAAAIEADPDYETRVRVGSIAPANVGGNVVVQVSGAAYSTDFKRATVELGFGEEPKKWAKVATLNNPVAEGVITNIATSNFNQRGKWSVRVVVDTKSHGKREARGNIDIQ
jgi:hypothetical protein